MQYLRNLCVATFVGVQLLSVDDTFAKSYGSATWEEANNRIKLKTVCANHRYGSISSRKCRSETSKYFVKQCDGYRKKYDSASSKKRAKYRKNKSKYCYAARHFKIVD